MATGYYPDGVPRHLPIPATYLDEALVSGPAKKSPDKVAIEYESVRTTYQHLDIAVDVASRAVQSLAGGKRLRVALLAYRLHEFVPAFLGILRAHCPVLLPDLSASANVFQRQMSEFAPELVITDERTGGFVGGLPGTVKALSVEQFFQTKGASPQPEKKIDLKAPAVAVGGSRGHICYHSHASLLATAMSWGAFLPLKEDDTVLNMQPAYSLEGLATILSALFTGATCIAGSLDEPDLLAKSVISHQSKYTWLTRKQVFALFDRTHRELISAFGEHLSGLFVSVPGYFPPRVRKLMKHWLRDVPVLTVFGFPEAGPVLSSHPTWYLDDSIGLPVCNVDVSPLDPDTGEPVSVPWDTLEYAEMGVRSPMVAAGFHTPEEKDAEVRDGWLRSHLVVTMDPTGIFYPQLHLPKKRKAVEVTGD